MRVWCILQGVTVLLQGDEQAMLDQLGFTDIGLAEWDIASTEAEGNPPFSYHMHPVQACREHFGQNRICHVLVPVRR